jgi:hypothetical protein
MTELPIIDAERPWPGLLPFTEEARMFFHGREAETDDLFRLIEREPLTVLFGQSGLGKSSLLNAGVFPLLRRAGYLPVYMRLSLDAAAPVLIDQVWQALMHECAEHEVSATAPQPGDSFWQYLHRPGTRFLNPHGRPVVPVLAFDQFEEIFTLGRQTPEQTARTQVLLQQLGELIENRLPPALENELTEHPELLDQFDLLGQNIKIVFTFREDYLADFEGLKTLIRPIMQNRMRLAPMRGDRAAEAIQQVGAGRLSATVAARIVRFVGGAARGDAGKLEEISVEPALLSLVCRELNEQRIARGQSEISADLIQGENTQQIIAQFYSQGFAGLDIRVRYFVEDRLLTAAGYRDSCALENALAEPGVSEEAIQTLVDRRILRREERGGLVRLELIHDVLAIVAKASRDARREAAALEAAHLLLAKQRRRQKIAAAWAAVLLAVLAGVSVLAVVAYRGKKEADAAKVKAVAAQRQADQQAQLAIAQQQIAQTESARAVSAEQLAKSKQLLLAGALEKADVATGEAKSETAQKEEQRRDAVVWAAAADEQLDSHGTGEQLRACVDSTNRLNNDPPPPATPDYMVGIWHVDQAGSSTDVDWRNDGTCAYRHIYVSGSEIDLSSDRCTWTYKRLDDHDFEIDWKSIELGPEYPKQLDFKILSPTRIHNTNLGYDAFRIVCPAQELTIRQSQLAALQKQAGADPGDSNLQLNLAGGYNKLGAALAAQYDPTNALAAYNSELRIYQTLEVHEPGNKTWQQDEAQSLGQIGQMQLVQAYNQGGTPNVTAYKAAIASYQKSLAIREQLLRATPDDALAQLNTAYASNQLGLALSYGGLKPRAAAAFHESLRLLQTTIDAHHGSPDTQMKLIRGLYSLSQVESDANAAKDDLRKAIVIATELGREPNAPAGSAGMVPFLQGALTKIH